MAIEIRQVTDKKDLKKFVQFNLDLYKDNPYHVPTLIDDDMNTLDWDKNPAFAFCNAVYWLAYKDNKLVGRIAGIINHKANESWNQLYARFGWVDFINDDEVVNALFNTVTEWAKEKGMEILHGPMGFCDMDHEGMLIEGFDQMSTFITIYNYAYYPKQLERIGFVKDQDWHEYLIQIPDQIPERHQRISNLVKEKYGLKVVKINSRREAKKWAVSIFETINAAYSPLYGYSELSEGQIKAFAEQYIPLLRYEMLTLIVREKDDKLIGLGLMFPSLSKALRATKGKIFPFGLLHLYNALKGKPKLVDLVFIAVLPEYQNKGINALIFSDLIPVCQKLGVKYAESNPELETNMAVRMQWNDFNRKHHKTRRAYIKELL